MSEIGTGDNTKQLRSVLERINRLEDDKKAIGSDIKDVYAEAKSNGYNPAALKIIVRKQRQDAAKAAQLEAEVDAYMASLGMLG